MFVTLEVLAVSLVSIAMALALAHALEFPVKMRLDKQTYLAVQPIYYPGFTIGGGVGEGGGIAATLILLWLTPSGSAAFGWTLALASAPECDRTESHAPCELDAKMPEATNALHCDQVPAAKAGIRRPRRLGGGFRRGVRSRIWRSSLSLWITASVLSSRAATTSSGFSSAS